MSKSIIYFIASVAVITLLVGKVFDLATASWQAKLNGQYLELAQKELAAGRTENAEEIVTQKVTTRYADEQELAALQQQIDRVQTDIFYEHEFMQNNGNEERAQLIKKVIGEYTSVKEMLEEAVVLWQSGETKYAQLLLQRAKSVNNGYTGVQMVENYFNQTNV